MSSHPVQNERQQREHRKMKLEAARGVRANLESALTDCRSRIANASRPRSLLDPVMQNRLPALREHESKLLGQIEACDASIQREYGDLLSAINEQTALKSPESAEIDRLNSDNASLRTLCDNQREQIRMLSAQLQAFKRAADSVKVQP